MAQLCRRANHDMEVEGYHVQDNKPQHVIVRPAPNAGLVKDKSGDALYGLVDFELLARTPAREEALRAAKRHDYLVRQAHRFEPREEFPASPRAKCAR
ncbi:MAG: hypothetical protein HQ582_08075 [Planctomycetes bacterium]|nr:hypothetical protein [Planctomycetota bacterium]